MRKRLLAGNPEWLDIGAQCFGDPVLGKVRGGDLVDLVSALVSSGLHSASRLLHWYRDNFFHSPKVGNCDPDMAIDFP